MFLWVSLSIESIGQRLREGDSLKTVKIELSSKSYEAVDDIYESLLRSLKSEDRPKALKFLQWLCYSKVSLSAGHIRVALCVDESTDFEDIEELLEQLETYDPKTLPLKARHLSCGLADIQKGQDDLRVTFIHQTALDFALHKGLPMLGNSSQGSQVQVIEANWRLSRSCLRILVNEESLRILDELSRKFGAREWWTVQNKLTERT